MSYTVTWKPSAISRLAELWEGASDRTAITEAADTIDAMLSKAAEEVGESRQENTKFLFVSPLAIYFDIFPADRKVSVWAVWKREKIK